MKTIRYELHEGIATLTFDEPDSPVNTMCADWQRDLGTVTGLVVRDKALIKGLILASAKSSFFAGADLKATMRLTPADARQVYAEIEQTKKNFRTLETLGVPVVSCLNGSALGGGWELALVGHHRIAIDHPRIQFGLPEITLGLIPGASGITKMTRLLGLAGAQPFILESRLVGPREALELGLVHELVPDALSLRAAAEAWIGSHPQSQQPWDRKDYRMPGAAPGSPQMAALLSVAPALLKQKTQGLYPAPEAALAAMVEGALVDFDTALRIESRYLAPLITGTVAKNMISAFFHDMNAVRSGASRPKDVPRWVPRKVGVVGAGMMGAGIAYVQASRGIETVLEDVNQETANIGKAYSQRLTQQRVDKGQMSVQEQLVLLDRITATDHPKDLKGCELIIEAVYENREVKEQITREAEEQLAPGGFFASNTSTLPISGLAKASRRPEKFVGIHFFSPVDKMKLVELIRGQRTDDQTLARAYDYVLALGKLPIVVNDSRGFYTSRTFGTYVTEGAAMVGEGIPAPVVENAAVQAGMPVGPLAVLDETSLSLAVHVLDQTRLDHKAEGRSYEASPGELLIERMVKTLRRTGRASGGGFYEYAADGRKRLWVELKGLFEDPQLAWDLQDVKDRLLYRQSVETARCLAEGVLSSAHDANIGSLLGIGFPAWTGGALQFVYGQGIEAFERRCDALARRFGRGFLLDGAAREALRRFQPRY